MNDILVPISPGELIDKLTILQIKSEKITDNGKLKNVRFERITLEKTIESNIPKTPEILSLTSALKDANQKLWDIEDAIRAYEHNADFGAEFTRLARAVYRTNDTRAELKKKINLLLNSKLVEEKSYTDY